MKMGTMKRMLLALALVVSTASLAGAADIQLSWAGDPTATSYDIQQSTDSGGTWGTVKNVPSTSCTGTPLICNDLVTVPSTGLILVRFAAKNAMGMTVRYDAGVWHCASCAPPAAPNTLKVQ